MPFQRLILLPKKKHCVLVWELLGENMFLADACGPTVLSDGDRIALQDMHPTVQGTLQGAGRSTGGKAPTSESCPLSPDGERLSVGGSRSWSQGLGFLPASFLQK